MTAAALLLLDLLASALPQVAAQLNGDMAVRDRTRSADMVDEWRVNGGTSRCLVLLGEPGFGKTAVAARLARWPYALPC